MERVVQAMHCGQARVMVANKGACGVSSVGNNYGRAEGQNVGNFMTGRNGDASPRAARRRVVVLARERWVRRTRARAHHGRHPLLLA